MSDDATVGGRRRSVLSGRERLAPLVDRAARRPILTLSVMAAGAAVLNLVWVHLHRSVGGLDVDEAGYLANAFGWRRLLIDEGPVRMVNSVFSQDTGPLQPVASSLTMLVAPTTFLAAMSVPAVMYALTAVAVGGIGLRLAGTRTAIISGVVALALPAGIISSRMYQLVPTMTAMLMLAVWAVLSSSRGHRRAPMVLAGVFLGLMLLGRTMSVIFVPGFVIAVALHVDRTRRTLINTFVSLGVAVVVAGPWWWVQRGALFAYLTSHGYGADGSTYGPGNLIVRILMRTSFVVVSAGAVWTALAVAVVVVAVRRSRAARRVRPSGDRAGLRRLSPRWFSAVSLSPRGFVWVVVVGGVVFLLSTANAGIFFELPMVVLMIPLVVAGVTDTDGPGVWRRTTVALSAAVAVFAVSLFDGGRATGDDSLSVLRNAVYPGLSNYVDLPPGVEPRLGSMNRTVRMDAMDEWSASNRAVLDALVRAHSVWRSEAVDADADEHDVYTVVCGNGPLFSANTLRLAGEMRGGMDHWSFEWLISTASEDEMATAFRQPVGTDDRMVVMVDQGSVSFPLEGDTGTCSASVDRLGWRPVDSVALPDGRMVSVLAPGA